MKAINTVLFLCLIISVANAKKGNDGRGSGEVFGLSGRNNERFLRKLNQSVSKIQNATVDPSTPLSTTVVNLWDLIPAVNRFLFLNQSQVKSLGWDVTSSLSSNTTRLQWSTLPTDVQNLLSTQFTNLGFLNLTFLDWSWVNSNTDKFYNTTLFSLLSPTQIQLLPNVTNLINQLSFSQVLNSSLLRRSHGFNELCDSLKLSYLPVDLGRFKRGFSRPRPTPPVTPWTLIDQAISRASRLLRSYLIRY